MENIFNIGGMVKEYEGNMENSSNIGSMVKE